MEWLLLVWSNCSSCYRSQSGEVCIAPIASGRHYCSGEVCIAPIASGRHYCSGEALSLRFLEICYENLLCLFITVGDIELVWCTTESMVADVMTKIVSGAQDKRLAARFYNDVDLSLCVLLGK